MSPWAPPDCGASRSGLASRIRRLSNCQAQSLYLTETALPDSFTTRTGSPTPLEAVLVDGCGNFISNGFVSATFSNGDPALSLESLGNGYYAASWLRRMHPLR